MILGTEPCACPIREIGPSLANICGPNFLIFMTILETYLNRSCDLADPCNRVQSTETVLDEYDFVIVGGGTAGPVVAARLSENPDWKVLLLEAGGDEPVAAAVPAFMHWHHDQTDWNYKTQPQENACLLEPNAQCTWPRGKMLGGCSAINGMMYVRGSKDDYDGWEKRGAKGWGWKDVFPYFLKSEDNKDFNDGEFHRTGGPLPVSKFRFQPKFTEDWIEATKEIGLPQTHDLNGQNNTGFTVAQALNDGGTRYSAARAFLRPATRRPNLHVLMNALGTRVVFKEGTKKVIGLEYYHGGEKKTVGIKKELILSAGTLNSPQILLLSGIGPRKTLEPLGIPVVQELSGVGQNLHDHVGVAVRFTLEKENATTLMDWTSVLDYLLNRSGPMASTGNSQLTGLINSRFADPSGKHPDIQYFFSGYSARCGSTGAINAPLNPTDPDAKRAIGIGVIYVQPSSRGYLTINSTSPFDPPLFYPNYLQNASDVEAIVDGAKIAYRIANTTILREEYGMKPKADYGTKCLSEGPDGSDAFLRCLAKYYTIPENHQVGTCAIGPDGDPNAVVDEQLRVRGIEGLRVVDAAVIPVVPSGSTSASVIMVGERGADFIKETYKTL